MRTAALLIASTLALAVAGCGDDDGSGGGGEVRVVATTAIAGDIAGKVGGGRVDVDVLVPADADPHDYEPRPSDAVALAEAGLVVRSGGDLDEWFGDLIESAGGDAAELTLLESVDTIEEGDDVDPHWWQNPRNAILAAEAVRGALAEADPEGRRAYARNAAGYVRDLRAL